MKILLFVPPHEKLVIRGNYCSNESKANYYIPPLDLVMQSGILSRKHNVEFIDAVAMEVDISETFTKISYFAPDVILFVTGGISEEPDEVFLRKLKEKFPKMILIGSGDTLLFKYEYYLKKWEFLDAILMDHTSFEILSFLDGDREKFDTLAYKKNNEIVHPNFKKDRGKIYGDLKNNRYMKVGIPRHELFLKFNYRIPHGIYEKFVLTAMSFGCPYSCIFCPMQRLVYKERDIEEVMEEMRYISSIGIKEVFFFDQTFAYNREDTLTFCEKMINENLQIKWICMSRVDVVDKELLDLMKKAGCHTIQFGVESADEDILKAIRKGLSTDKCYKIFNYCKEIGIKTLGHFIIGLPGENFESVKATVDYAIQLGCDYASFNIAEAPLGTNLRDEAVKKGLIDCSKQASFLAFQAYVPEGLSFEQLVEWRDYAVKKFYFRPTYILKKLFFVRSFYELKNNFREGIGLLNSVLGKFSYKRRIGK